MSADAAPSSERRARIWRTRNAIAHLWHGGILSHEPLSKNKLTGDIPKRHKEP
jgi:hypothetical protein